MSSAPTKKSSSQWSHVLGARQRKAFAAIRDCRPAALGGHVEYVEQCDTCGHRVISYYSCRDRHCPKCQATARAEWLAEREDDLLPVPYFHVVFTLPQQIGVLEHSRTRERFTASCFAPLRKPCSPLQPIPNVLAPRSGSSPFCTLGAEPSPSSTSPLRRARRRHWPGRRKLGRLPEAFILPSRGGIGMPVQECLPLFFEEVLSRRQAAFPRRDGRSGENRPPLKFSAVGRRRSSGSSLQKRHSVDPNRF
jgi:hypothetical protein